MIKNSSPWTYKLISSRKPFIHKYSVYYKLNITTKLGYLIRGGTETLLHPST